MNRPLFALLLVLLVLSCKKEEPVIYPDGTTRLLRVRSADGFVREAFDYDTQGRVLTHRRFFPGQTASEETTYAYDAQGRLLNARATRLIYTCGTCEGVPTKFTETFAYDGNGRLVESQDAGENGLFAGRWTYEYDATGRLTRQNAFTDAERLGGYAVFGYDARGNILKADYFQVDGNLLSRNVYEYDRRPNPFPTVYRGIQAALFRSPNNIVRDKYEYFGILNGMVLPPDYDRATRYTYDPITAYPVRAEASDGTVSIFEYQ